MLQNSSLLMNITKINITTIVLSNTESEVYYELDQSVERATVAASAAPFQV